MIFYKLDKFSIEDLKRAFSEKFGIFLKEFDVLLGSYTPKFKKIEGKVSYWLM